MDDEAEDQRLRIDSFNAPNVDREAFGIAKLEEVNAILARAPLHVNAIMCTHIDQMDDDGMNKAMVLEMYDTARQMISVVILNPIAIKALEVQLAKFHAKYGTIDDQLDYVEHEPGEFPDE